MNFGEIISKQNPLQTLLLNNQRPPSVKALRKKITSGWMPWFMPVIHLLKRQRWGGGSGEWQFKASQGKRLARSSSQLIIWAWWYIPVIPATWEAVDKRIKI
jgi:hypothetical protein